MLKKISIIIGALIICALLFLSLHGNFGFNPNYSVGVIKSNLEDLDSAISYYDENLNLLYTRKLFLGNLTCSGNCFVVLGKKKYMLSRGTYWIGCPYAMELDAETGKIKKYKIDLGHNLAMAVNDKYIFSTYSSLDANINRCDKKTGELKKMSVAGTCKGMYLDEKDILYVFAGDPYDDISNLYIVDAEKLEILKTFDIRETGCNQDQFIKVENYLYFLNDTKYHKNNDGIGERCHTLTKFNTKTYDFKDIDIGIVPHKMVKFEDSLYITSIDDSSNGMVVIYNVKTGDIQKSKIKEKSANFYMTVDEKNRKLYTTGGAYLYKYDLPSLKLLKKIDCLGKDEKKYTAFTVFTK